MSEHETATSPLTRLVPGLTLLALVVMISSAIFHVVTLSPAPVPAFSRETAPPAPDYEAYESWYNRPDVQTEGGWAKPWGVDLIWYAGHSDNYASGWNLPLDWAGRDQAYQPDAEWFGTLPSPLMTFVPQIRHAVDQPGEAEDYQAAQELAMEDALAAFDYYAQHDHRQRGFFLGGRGYGAELAKSIHSQRVDGSPLLKKYFAGFIVADHDAANSFQPEVGLPTCAEAADTFPCVLDISGLAPDAAAAAVETQMAGMSAWMDDNVGKPAEPLPPLETIEIAPVHKPDNQ